MIGTTPEADVLVGQLRAFVLEELESERARRLADELPDLSRDNEQRYAKSLLRQRLGVIRGQQIGRGEKPPSPEADEDLIATAYDALFGMGRMQSLIDDQKLIEINCQGCDEVWLTFEDGRTVAGPPVAATDDELIDWVKREAMYSGTTSKPWDASNWSIQMRLRDGSRLVGVREACVRPIISIRLTRLVRRSLDDLRALGDFDSGLQAFLEAAVAARANIIVSGETGSGKTTLVRAMARCFPASDRLVTIEHFRELGLDEDKQAHPNVAALEERLANAEGEGAITLGDLVVMSRRLNPTRLIVGEVLGPEVVAFLDGMTQGNDGGITTLHAKNARMVPSRIAQYSTRAGLSFESGLVLAADAIDLVVHLSTRRNQDGTLTWWVSSIVELLGYDGHQVITSEVWATPAGSTRAVPAAAVSTPLRERLSAVGWDASSHLPGSLGGVS